MLLFAVSAAATTGAALLVLACWSWLRSRVAWFTFGAAIVSLIATAIGSTASATTLGLLGTLEALAVAALIVPTARFAPVRAAVVAGATAHLAVTVWVLRARSQISTRSVIGGCAFWSLLATGAVAGAVYLRVLDERRRRSVADARRRQRLDLARDLHDFVAHDVSAMLAQAQAGRYLGAADPEPALAALQRIEEAGLRALESMDRTVRMLHDAETSEGEGPGCHPAPGLEELPRLVDRFGAIARLTLAPAAADGVPREVSAAVYRIVVEALTNVRRHAPGADEVLITVARSASTLTLDVVNSASKPGHRAAARAGRRGGLGLPGLAERVAALGGTLDVGPEADGAWRLSAAFPLAPVARAGR